MIPVHVQTIELVKNRVARQVSVGRLSKEVFVFFAESGMSVRVHDLSISIPSQSLAPISVGKYRCFRVPAQANAELCSNTLTQSLGDRHGRPTILWRNLTETADISGHMCVFVGRCVHTHIPVQLMSCSCKAVNIVKTIGTLVQI